MLRASQLSPTTAPLRELEKREVTLADGRRTLVPYMGPIEVRFDGRRCFTGACDEHFTGGDATDFELSVDAGHGKGSRRERRAAPARSYPTFTPRAAA
jgi:hypothetical protein